MSFLSKLVGIGLVAGAAVAAVKLIEKVWPQDNALDDVVYTLLKRANFRWRTARTPKMRPKRLTALSIPTQPSRPCRM